MNVANLLLRAGRAYAERPAVVAGKDRIFADYGALLGRVEALAAGLERTFALAPGDRVALIMRNCAFYIESLFACWYGGWVAVPVNAKLHPREFAYVLAHSGARLCLVSEDLAEQIEAIRPELPRSASAVIAVGDHDVSQADRGRAGDDRRPGAGGHSLAVLHQRHHRPAEGRDAHATATCWP